MVKTKISVILVLCLGLGGAKIMSQKGFDFQNTHLPVHSTINFGNTKSNNKQKSQATGASKNILKQNKLSYQSKLPELKELFGFDQNQKKSNNIKFEQKTTSNGKQIEHKSKDMGHSIENQKSKTKQQSQQQKEANKYTRNLKNNQIQLSYEKINQMNSQSTKEINSIKKDLALIEQKKSQDQSPKQNLALSPLKNVKNTNIITKQKKIIKKVVIPPKLPANLIQINLNKNKVNWIAGVQHQDQEKDIKVGKDKSSRPKIQQQLEVVQKQKKNSSVEVNKQTKQDKKLTLNNHQNNFFSQASFENPKVLQSKIFNQIIDGFHPPIQISSGSALTNRLTTQFAKLSLKKISFIQRFVTLKKKSNYKIRFEWQSNEPEGQLQVFWNHRLVGSFKSLDTNSKAQILHVRGSFCQEGVNILKFIVSGPVQVGVDNIQIIS